MKSIRKVDRVTFTTKGQIVIPSALRRQFEIGEGTRALVTATEDGILLKPITVATIRHARGILERKPGQKTLAAEWAEHKREERKLEERRYGHGV